MIETGAVGWDVFDGNVDVSRFGTNENPSTDKLSRAINWDNPRLDFNKVVS